MFTASTSAASVIDVHRIVYVSAATQRCSEQEIERLLQTARTNNRKMKITGMLLHHEQSFLQMIEGPAGALNVLFGKLRADPRHHKIVLLLRERIRERSFADWPMGFAGMTTDELKTIPGMMDFFSRRTALGTLTPTRAVRLLMAFKSASYCAEDGRVTTAGVPVFLDKRG